MNLINSSPSENRGNINQFFFGPKGDRWMEIDCIVIHESSSYSGVPIRSADLHNKGALFSFHNQSIYDILALNI